MFQPLRVKTWGDSESWRSIAMFDGKIDVEDLKEELYYGEAGPGQPFSTRPFIVKKGKFVFVHQSGGLDV